MIKHILHDDFPHSKPQTELNFEKFWPTVYLLIFLGYITRIF